MKLKIIILSMFLCLSPFLVKADAGGPSFTQYDVKVVNENGTYIEKWNQKTGKLENVLLPYGTIIKGIYFEEDRNGVTYGYSDEGTIILDDCEVITDDLDFSIFRNDPGKLYVYKEGAYLYEGPSKQYKKLNDGKYIPVGTTLEYTYSDELFAYVTYNGISGWVYYYGPTDLGLTGSYQDGSSLARVEKGKVHTISKTYIYDSPINGNKLDVVIDENETVDYKYTYLTGIYTTSYYITYKGVSGWIENENSNLAKVYSKAKVYSYKGKVDVCEGIGENCKLVTTIPQNTMLDVEYVVNNFDYYLYVTYNGKSGWIYEDTYADNNFRYSLDTDIYNIKVDKEMYDKDFGNLTGETLKSGEVEVYNFYIYDEDYNSHWLYLVKNNKWINVADDEYEFVKKQYTEEVKTESNINNLLIYFVGGALVLSLATFVTIKLVNKNIKENNN